MRLITFANKKILTFIFLLLTCPLIDLTVSLNYSLFFIKKMAKIVNIFSNSKKVTVTFSTWELLFIFSSLLKVIRLDKGNIKFNYRVYKIIDKLTLTLNNI